MWQHWFINKGWVHLPAHVIGYIIFLAYTAMNVWFFIVIDSHSHSVSDTLINFFPYGIGFGVMYEWIASHTAKKIPTES